MRVFRNVRLLLTVLIVLGLLVSAYFIYWDLQARNAKAKEERRRAEEESRRSHLESLRKEIADWDASGLVYIEDAWIQWERPVDRMQTTPGSVRFRLVNDTSLAMGDITVRVSFFDKENPGDKAYFEILGKVIQELDETLTDAEKWGEVAEEDSPFSKLGTLFLWERTSPAKVRAVKRKYGLPIEIDYRLLAVQETIDANSSRTIVVEFSLPPLPTREPNWGIEIVSARLTQESRETLLVHGDEWHSELYSEQMKALRQESAVLEEQLKQMK